MNKTYSILIGIFIAILLGAAIYMGLQLKQSKEENIELVKNFELDKQELENEYAGFAKQYDELKFTIQNDSMAEKLTAERAKVQHLLEELRSVKSSNASEIRRLKGELATLRKVLVSYVKQIDSLNRENQGLRIQAQEITARYEQAAAQASTLAQEKENLTEKVSLAAQLDATGITLQAKNKKGKIAKKIKDITKLQINFNISRNVTAETGTKTLYVRIVKPDNSILGNAGSFSYENRTLPYSLKKIIEYTGEEQAITVYWDVNEFLYAGQYRVEIFTENQLIGSRKIPLE